MNIRPPGHHAKKDIANGYCYFNNVAILAEYYWKENPGKKVFILDWDIHVGDGTYAIFEESKDVMTISTHWHDDGTYWPFGTWGSYTNIGKGEGTGFHFLLGLNGHNGDHEFK